MTGKRKISSDAEATEEVARVPTPGLSEKKRRIVGPALPPSASPAGQAGADPGSDDASSSEGDFGPALPRTGVSNVSKA